MRQLREILRLRLQAEISVRQIQRSLRVSVGAVSKILSKASGLGLNWKDVEALNDIQLANFFYPNADTRPFRQFEVPDWSDPSLYRHFLADWMVALSHHKPSWIMLRPIIKRSVVVNFMLCLLVFLVVLLFNLPQNKASCRLVLQNVIILIA